MDTSTAHWLVSEDGRAALERASSWSDPSSMAAAQGMRRTCTAEQAAAALSQASLRRRAAAKFGEAAASLFFTPDALEQATRPAVAAWRAVRFAAAGVQAIWDLGCGIGADALAFRDAGITVVAVERDPVTAILAGANLGPEVEVLTGDVAVLGVAGSVGAGSSGAGSSGAGSPGIGERRPLAGDGIFCDPARRTARGRSWRVEDFSPSWEFVIGLLDGRRPACVKVGPGIPRSLIPASAQATWVSDHGDLVEASLWAGLPGSQPGVAEAVLLPQGRVLTGARGSTPGTGEVGRYLYEPDPAVIRAGATASLADTLGAWAVAPGIAYLTGDRLQVTPFAEAFEVLQVLPTAEKALRAWVRERRVGVLEIKKRGIDLDPAELRRRLRPSGPEKATLILTPTPTGAVALVVRRVSRA
jgi:hypothetical protein